MSRVVHFEYAVDDADRAVAFYQNVFGWKVEQWGDQKYWLLMTGEEGQPGINGALTPRQENWPNVVNTLDVASVDAAVAAVAANGGTVLESKLVIPGVGYLAYCQDTEGNIFGMMQSDPSAQPA